MVQRECLDLQLHRPCNEVIAEVRMLLCFRVLVIHSRFHSKDTAGFELISGSCPPYFQKYRHPQLDYFVGVLATLVSTEFYSLVLPLLFWVR